MGAAPGADPDVRLLYLHGGGFVAGCSDYYLALGGRILAAAGCAVLLINYRLAPKTFPRRHRRRCAYTSG